METPQWAGYYHIYLIIVWRIHSGRVIIIFTLLLYGDSTVGGLLSYLPNNSMETPQDDGLLSYLPNYSMKTPQWAGYYHIYLIIVWKPHRVTGYYYIYLIIVWRPHSGRVIIIFT